ncbi:hypothetical protein JCM10207_003591 [Rhodosporidiobolus poonsookiae]
MASAVASTSTHLFPPLAVAPSLVYPAAALPTPPPLPTSLVLDKGDAAIPTEKSGGRLKRFMCTWPNCGKCYTRPVRLEEHQRTHTGERPFACPQCSSTFARDSHLKAHMRTHKSAADKAYICAEEGCDKKFWTSQHLKKHIEVVHQGKTYDCPSCDKTFRKHHLLRTHIAEAHSAPGTNPFICEHPGCGRSFKQKVHLKSHEKTHDPSRYVCLHPACASLPQSSRQFGTWTLLQRHTKSAHPPTCPYPECAGRTFTNRRGLRGHLALHEEDSKEALGAASGTATEGEDGQKKSSRKRRRRRRVSGAEDGAVRKGKGKGKRRVKLESEDEDEEYEPELEDEEDEAQFTADEGDNEEGSEWEERQESERDERMREDFRYGGKKKRRVLADAVGFPPLPFPPLPAFPLVPLPDPTLSSSDELFARLSAAEHDAASTPEPEDKKHKKSVYLDLLTGANYASASNVTSTSTTSASPSKKGGLASVARRYPCPFPAILALPFTDLGPGAQSVKPEPDSDDDGALGGEDDSDCEGMCRFRFKRVYDVERHLRARHGVEMKGGRKVLDEWFKMEEE